MSGGRGARRAPAAAAPAVVRRFDTCPDLLPLHQAFPQRYPHLLESVVNGPEHARFDILFAFPGATLELTDGFQLRGGTGPGDGFLEALDRWCRAEGHAPAPDVPVPFHGGWFLYLGYELGTRIEPTVPLPPGGTGAPRAFATRVPAAIVRDHAHGRVYAVAEARSAHLLDVLTADLAAVRSAPAEDPGAAAEAAEDDPDVFLRGVARIKDYIAAGDVFQVNLSRAWRGRWRGGAAALYRRLRRHNPGPFAGIARYRDFTVVSSSPERLVSVSADGAIETRPIAGTRPRGQFLQDDHALSEALLAHPKERAEHVMLIDLERNDLGRVCRPGSVRVTELMHLETYRHVHHIVSNVRGRLDDGATPGRVIAAVFPGGTITGCPKVRCMQIIAELEGRARGPYTGSMGYLNRDGSMDLNILIRTLHLQGGHWTLRTGAGIVADSDPEMELAETRAKAKGLLLALAGHADP